MSIREIEKRIIEEANAEASSIDEEAQRSRRQLEKVNEQKQKELRQAILEEGQRKADEIKRSHLVPARLKARKAVLEEKQKLLAMIYDEVKKQRKLSGAEIKKVREETEVKAAGLLFGEK